MSLSLYRHLFFDLDGTVTRSRSLITDEMRTAFKHLTESGRDAIIVSGAQHSQILKQVDGVTCFCLGQNGNQASDPLGHDLWVDRLSDAQKVEIWAHIRSIPRDWPVNDEDDLVEDRGAQISYSLLGHHEDISKKEAFDPGGKKRSALLVAHPFVSGTVSVKIGGTTCLDYFEKGKDKGHNVARLIETQGWKKEECVYVGDALYPGGNDEAVIGVIDTHPVKDPGETLAFIATVLG
jgi:HAD superfamily hydrolase (TIGR01484 family)